MVPLAVASSMPRPDTRACPRARESGLGLQCRLQTTVAPLRRIKVHYLVGTPGMRGLRYVQHTVA